MDGTNEIMRLTTTSKPTVWRWQDRYIKEGVEGLVEGLLRDKTRPSIIAPISTATRLAAKKAGERPTTATHWSRSTMATEMGGSATSVGRIWAEAGPKPHLVAKFKVSNDPWFESDAPAGEGADALCR